MNINHRFWNFFRITSRWESVFISTSTSGTITGRILSIRVPPMCTRGREGGWLRLQRLLFLQSFEQMEKSDTWFSLKQNGKPTTLQFETDASQHSVMPGSWRSSGGL